MDLRLQVEIKESLEELEKAVKYATTASSKERLQMQNSAKKWSSHKSASDRQTFRTG
jgi:hypothetical protein